MNKRISTNLHCFISVVGPAGCGKTRLIAKMISNQKKIFRPSFDRIIYFYKHNQESYEKLRFECSTNPENFIKTETSIFHDESLVIRGERLQKLIKVKTTETLGCKFVSSWEIEKVNSLGNCAESEKPVYIFQKFLELEKSDAPFKDTIISYINLLQRGMGRLFVTEHSRTLDIDLGVSNAQCTCYEFLYQPLPETQDDQSRNCQLFPLFNEDTIFDTSFL